MGSNGHRPIKSRMLRRLLRGRRPVAFVLSGGGSLGAIQVGMLQALFDAGIKPDMLIGTSVGAVNAAWVGGWPNSEGVARLAEIWKGLRRDDVFPLGWTAAAGLLGRSNHLISNAGLRSVLERHIPYERLEQAQVPVHVVASELRNGRASVLSSGPAVPALLASCAIPGVFPPVTIGKRDLVDGGVANHTPIEAASSVIGSCTSRTALMPMNQISTAVTAAIARLVAMVLSQGCQPSRIRFSGIRCCTMNR